GGGGWGVGAPAGVSLGATLRHGLPTPPLYGQRWEAAVDGHFATITPADAGQRLGRLADVTGWTFGNHGIVGIGGHVIPAIGLAAGKGPPLSPTLLPGHPPPPDTGVVLWPAPPPPDRHPPP